MKCKIRHKALWLVLAAILLVACTANDSPENANNNGGKDSEIRLNAEVWRVMEGTRATVYNGGTLSSGSFICTAYDHGETTVNTTSRVNATLVNWVEDHWEFDDGAHVWPTAGALDFFAYMPADLTYTYCTVDLTPYDSETNSDGYSAGTPRFTCADLPVTITRGSDNTNELILAYAADQDKAGTNSTLQPTPAYVALNFKHPFARVYFKLSDESAASEADIVVNTITIPAIYRDGVCAFNGTAQTFTWSSLDDNDEGIVISAPSDGEQATDATACYLVIPNNYGMKTFTVNATWKEWGEEVTDDISANVNINWEPGKSYIYTLTITKYALIVNVNKFTEQW